MQQGPLSPDEALQNENAEIVDQNKENSETSILLVNVSFKEPSQNPSKKRVVA